MHVTRLLAGWGGRGTDGVGLPAATVFTLACLPFLRSKALGAALVFLSYHLHLLCDLVGSAGGNPGYLAAALLLPVLERAPASPSR
jgi:hypothetical protein